MILYFYTDNLQKEKKGCPIGQPFLRTTVFNEID